MKPTNLSDKIKKQERSRRDQRIALGLIGAGVVLGGALFVCVPAISSQINELNTPAINKEAAVAAAIATTTPTNADAYSHLNLIAKSAIVYDLTDGKVLYAQNAYEQLPLASITKLLTLYAATSVLSPSSTVTMTPVALSQDGDAADNGFTDV
jgi:D-alanyl-D-alanine carboxypeptidase